MTATPPRRAYDSETEILTILTGVFGRSPASRGVFEILSTTSIPSITLPKTGCLDGPAENQSRYGLSATLMKNWQLPLWGPLLAIESVPREFEILALAGCSSGIVPLGASPVPARGLWGSLLYGQPNWTMNLSMTRWKCRPS